MGPCFLLSFFMNLKHSVMLKAKADILGVVLCGEMHTFQIFLNLNMIWMCMLKFSRNFCMELNTKTEGISSSGKHLRLSKWCEI